LVGIFIPGSLMLFAAFGTDKMSFINLEGFKPEGFKLL
jgi:hypothetical protein